MKTDRNLVSYWQERPLGERFHNEILADKSYSDALKFSSCADGVVHVKKVVGGKEDCLDVNNLCSDLVIGDSDTIWEPKGNFCITVKGGSRNITVNGIVKGHGDEVDVDLGNWSDQSKEPTRNVILNLRSWDGSPLTYRYLNADKPVLRGGKWKKKFGLPKALRKPFLAIYGLFKRLG